MFSMFSSRCRWTSDHEWAVRCAQTATTRSSTASATGVSQARQQLPFRPRQGLAKPDKLAGCSGMDHLLPRQRCDVDMREMRRKRGRDLRGGHDPTILYDRSAGGTGVRLGTPLERAAGPTSPHSRMPGVAETIQGRITATIHVRRKLTPEKSGRTHLRMGDPGRKYPLRGSSRARWG